MKILGKVENLVCRILRVLSTENKIWIDVHVERGKYHTATHYTTLQHACAMGIINCDWNWNCNCNYVGLVEKKGL